MIALAWSSVYISKNKINIVTVDVGGCMGVERVVEFILIVGVSRLFWSLDYFNHESRVAVEKCRDDAVRELF